MHRAAPLLVAFGLLALLLALAYMVVRPDVTFACDFRRQREADVSLADWRLNSTDESFASDGLSIATRSIYAVDGRNVFLYGRLAPSCCFGRSLLLRSTDSGCSWHEVPISQEGHTVLAMQFLSGNSGWVLTQWVIEGPGDINVVHTTDAGATWQLLPAIPRRDWTGAAFGFRFDDDLHGRVFVNYDFSTPPVLEAVETTDGGRTWRSAGSAALEDPDTPGSWGKEVWQSVGRDGTIWSLAEDPAGVGLRLTRRRTAGTPAEDIAIPGLFEYAGG